MAYCQIKYESWDQFKSDYSKDLFEREYVSGKYVFRGQRDADWSLISSFDRQYKSMEWSKRKRIEEELIKVFIHNCNNILSSVLQTEIGSKSLAQHYGIPTRLLDWSYSPFIAAYFAFASFRSSADGRVAIWALKKDHEIWNSDLGVKIEDFLHPENDRQKRQQGCFSIINNQQISIDGFEDDCHRKGINTSGALYKITIPASEYKNALCELEAMNINAMSIYGGLEGCALAARDAVRLKYLE